MTREDLVRELSEYQTPYPSEQRFVSAFLLLLQEKGAFERGHMIPGHVTGSAWITDPANQFVLLTHHAKLNRWLQPGGHADGDEDVLRVATREGNEETGVTMLRLVSPAIYDLDIHRIPAKGDVPAHLHYDIRYHFHADKDAPLVVTSESHALAWVSLEELARQCGNNDSMLRMADKLASA